MQRILIKETVKQVGQEVLLQGWVHVRRDMGKIIFIDLRDRSGLIQVVFTPGNKEVLALANSLRPEYVVAIQGMVKERPAKMVNPKLETGTIEMEATALEILNEAKTPPFEIDKDTRMVNEELRLKYRYLDLRSERMRKNLLLRHQIIDFIRNWLSAEDFLEVNTPILTKSTPEGARDYLVPSRVYPGKFYALPQSPQQYKQLLMIAGIERYFQIAPCFRDEDARADRSPGEFYQLDMEMSFVKQNDILELVEKMMIELAQKLFPEKKITKTPFPRISYDEAMAKYQSDKPDLREDKNDPNELAFAWVIDFPLFTKQTAEDFFHGAGKVWAPSHHMFTAPKEEDIPFLDSDPGKVKSYQHDLVLNGVEVGGGSIRIHKPELQEKIFDLIGFSVEQKQMFSHLLEAFQYGAPPHGGIAPGLDRLIRILAGENNIREVIAFPKSGDARDVTLDAPSEVAKEQLKEVHLKITN